MYLHIYGPTLCRLRLENILFSLYKNKAESELVSSRPTMWLSNKKEKHLGSKATSNQPTTISACRWISFENVDNLLFNCLWLWNFGISLWFLGVSGWCLRQWKEGLSVGDGVQRDLRVEFGVLFLFAYCGVFSGREVGWCLKTMNYLRWDLKS